MTKSRGIRPFIARGSIEERFWQKVNKKSNDECWDWLGSTRSDGYGQINRGQRGFGMQSTHRLSREIHFGKIPDGMHVLHSCDNQRCVNPSHLFLGTNNDNIADRVSKGRSMRGESHFNSKLTEEDVLEIRKLYIPWDRDFSLYALARKYNVTMSAIHDIVTRKNWKWLKENYA